MHLFEQFFDDCFLRLVERFAGRVHRQDDVLRDRKVRQQVEALEDHADVMAAETVAVSFRQVGAIDQHHAFRGGRQSRDERQQRGLARSGRSGDGMHLAGLEIVADVLQHTLAAFGVGVADIVQAQCGRIGPLRLCAVGFDGFFCDCRIGGIRGIRCHGRSFPGKTCDWIVRNGRRAIWR